MPNPADQTTFVQQRPGGRPSGPASVRPVPARLGRYQIVCELGKGAMGVVYRARDPMINREVALKTIPLAAEFEGEELEQARVKFFREAEAAGRLSHPHIVTIYDAGEHAGTAYIAMELLRGRAPGRLHRPGAPAAAGDRDRGRGAAGGRARTTRTSRASCTATSSRPTSCSTRRAATEDHRLRHRPHHRFRTHAHRHRARHAVLHVARAVAGRGPSPAAPTCSRSP